MANRQTYPFVHEQLRALALQARSEGVGFDEWWTRALRPGLRPVTWKTPPHLRPAGSVVWPNDTRDRQISQEVHSDPDVVEGWRAAYEGRDDSAWAWAGPLAALLDEDASDGAGRVLAAA